MGKKNTLNIYDICTDIIYKEKAAGEPGENLRKIFKKSVDNVLLKTFILKSCRHPEITSENADIYKNMIRSAMQATYADWANNDWINKTFKPIADLLDKIENPVWQEREKVEYVSRMPDKDSIEKVIQTCIKDIYKAYNSDKKDPWIPVAAQVVLSGDDYMNGENFLNVLRGLGAFEYKNITMMFYFLRCFLMVNPGKRKIIRKPYKGICEPMRQPVAWIWNRTAYYDVIFFEQLLTRINKNEVSREEFNKTVDIMENLMKFVILKSQEWLVSPNEKIKHPSITCLPKDANGNPLCHMTKSAWQKKADLGFSDYVPDTDTTFLSLSMARKWIDFTKKHKVIADKELLSECEKFLEHPWVQIINEYQVGSGYTSNPATIQITKPLDYFGAVPIWFDKPFTKPDGRVIRETLGNEICPGHNMDILESLLANRKQWKSLEGKNLETTQRFLEFHYRAFTGGNYKIESALKYYLPEIYVYYTGRVYDMYLSLSDAERKVFDPESKFEKIRDIAIEYCKNDILGKTVNAFDASLAVAALVLLRYEPKNDGVIATGIQVMLDSAGEGRKGHPFKAYEWNKMRHPSRILVGSDVSTSVFVMNALAEAKHYLYGK